MLPFAKMSLQRRLSLFVLTGLLFTFAVFTYLGFDAVSNSTDRELQQRLIIGEVAADHVDQVLERGLRQLRDGSIAVGIDPEEGDSEALRGALSHIRDDSELFTYDLFLLDSRGVILCTSPYRREVVGTTMWDYSTVRQTLRDGVPTISGVILAPVTHRPVIALTHPIKSQDGRVIGLIGGAIDLTSLESTDFARPIYSGRTGRNQVVDGNGIIIASTNPDNALRPWDHAHHLLDSVRAKSSLVGVFESTAIATYGRKDVVALVPLPHTEWSISIEQDEVEALAPALDVRNRMIFFGALALLGALFLTWTVTASVLRPIKVLTGLAQKIAGGDLDQGIGPMGRDEIGQLAASFDTMRISLRSSLIEVERWNRELEDRVRRRTSELSTLLDVSKAFASQSDLEATLHTVLARVVCLLQPANAAGFFAYDGRTGLLVGTCSAGLPESFRDLRLHPAEGIVGRAFQAGQAVLCTGQEQLAEVFECLPMEVCSEPGDMATSAFRPQSAICVPLASKDRAIGSLIVISYHSEQLFTSHDVSLLQGLAGQIATAIQKDHLMREASQAEALRELDRLRSELLATVSHELRTPLSAIKGYAGSLLRKDVSWNAATRNEFLQGISDESDRLDELIDNLLDMSRIEAGMLCVEKQPANVVRIIDSAISVSRLRASTHRFATDLPNWLPTVSADPRRIEQVLRNLLDNAVKCSPAASTIKVGAHVDQSQVIVSVSDEGCGIPAEYMEKIFERFYRIDREPGNEGRGSGLGLPICRGILQAHGGRIWVQSEVGKGTKVSFTLVPEEEERDPEIRHPDDSHMARNAVRQVYAKR